MMSSAVVSSVSSFNGLRGRFSTDVVVVLEVPADPLALVAAVVLTLAHGAATNRWFLAHGARDRGFHLVPLKGAQFVVAMLEENDGAGQFSFFLFPPHVEQTSYHAGFRQQAEPSAMMGAFLHASLGHESVASLGGGQEGGDRALAGLEI